MRPLVLGVNPSADSDEEMHDESETQTPHTPHDDSSPDLGSRVLVIGEDPANDGFHSDSSDGEAGETGRRRKRAEDEENVDPQSISSRSVTQARILRDHQSIEAKEGESLYAIGQKVDVLDCVEKWSEAEIAETQPGTVRVSYTYWSDKFDEWIDLDREAHRIQRANSHTYQGDGRFCVNQRLEVLDSTNRWLEAYVIEAHLDRIRVHYKGWSLKFDEDIQLADCVRRVRRYGLSKRVEKRNIARERQQSVVTSHRRVRKLQTTSHHFDRYVQSLRAQHLSIRSIDGDGNCMFRSVAHQVYGDDTLHALVRQKCMDYMESEKHYFEPYVEGDMHDYMNYVAHKRRLGVWGDDPELQAMCELYHRRAEVWSFDPNTGARVMRTFHESHSERVHRTVMRLSYYGGGHYDSIVGPEHQMNLIRTPPGELENRYIEFSRSRELIGLGEEEKQQESAAAAAEQDEVEAALAASRDEFDRLDGDLDQIFDSELSTALSQADTEATDQHLLQSAEESELQHVLAISATDDEQQLQAAMAASTTETTDPELAHALAMSTASEEDELKRALELSRTQRGAASDEDYELQVALAMSQHSQEALEGGVDEDDFLLQQALALSSSTPSNN